MKWLPGLAYCKTIMQLGELTILKSDAMNCRLKNKRQSQKYVHYNYKGVWDMTVKTIPTLLWRASTETIQLSNRARFQIFDFVINLVPGQDKHDTFFKLTTETLLQTLLKKVKMKTINWENESILATYCFRFTRFGTVNSSLLCHFVAWFNRNDFIRRFPPVSVQRICKNKKICS